MKGMRAAAGRIGLRTKLFAVIITALVISVILVGVFVLANQRRLLQTMVADSLAAAERVVENKLLGKAEQALGISLAVAAMPEIVTAAVDQDRAAIVDTVVAIYEQVHAALGVDVLHVRAPYDTSLVRGQNPSLYGDVQSRGGILDSGSQGRPLLGFDRGPFGMGMRGWAPIKHGGVVVGTVETNILYGRTASGYSCCRRCGAGGVCAQRWGLLSLLTATPGVKAVSELQQLVPGAEAERAGGNWAHSFLPIISYDGAELAMVAVAVNTAGYQQMIMRQSLQLIAGLAVGSLVFIGILSYVLRRILRPLQAVSEAADAIADGDFTARLPEVSGSDEVGRLVCAFTGMIGSLNEMMGSLTAAINEMSSASQAGIVHRASTGLNGTRFADG